jgi:hypothetical protein
MSLTKWYGKTHRYGVLLLEILRQRTKGLLAPENIVSCAANPGERIYIQVHPDGSEHEIVKQPPPDLLDLKDRLWELLEDEGKSLSAINASLFAGRVSDRVATGIAQYNRDTTERVIRTFCIGKGVAVALNPIPIADLLTVIADAALVINLGKIYGQTITPGEASGLIRTMLAQMALLMSAVFGVHLASSALKGVSLGLSTVFTAGTQGAVAYYTTYVIGRATEQYFLHDKSWGEGGPKRVIQQILDSVDRESLLAQARADILARIKPAT